MQFPNLPITYFPVSVFIKRNGNQCSAIKEVLLLYDEGVEVELEVDHDDFCDEFEIVFITEKKDEENVLKHHCYFVPDVGAVWVNDIVTMVRQQNYQCHLFEWYGGWTNPSESAVATRQVLERLQKKKGDTRFTAIKNTLLGKINEGDAENAFKQLYLRKVDEDFVKYGTFYHEEPQMTQEGVATYKIPDDVSTFRRSVRKMADTCLLCTASDKEDCLRCRKEENKENGEKASEDRIKFSISVKFLRLEEIIVWETMGRGLHFE